MATSRCEVFANQTQPRWSKPDYFQCLSYASVALSQKMSTYITEPSSDTTKELLNNLQQLSSLSNVTEADLLVASEVLRLVANYRQTNLVDTVSDTEVQMLTSASSNLLSTAHISTWNSIYQTGNGSSAVMKSLEDYTMAISNRYQRKVTRENIAIGFDWFNASGYDSNEILTFPPVQAGSEWLVDTKVLLPLKTLKNYYLSPGIQLQQGSNLYVSSVSYRYMHHLLPPTLLFPDISTTTKNPTATAASSYENESVSLFINSKIIQGSLIPLDSEITLNPPISLWFTHIQANLSEARCVSWNFSTSTWTESGCFLVESNLTHSKCSCTHVTNFALLMSPLGENIPSDDAVTLSLISTIGCSISTAALIITLIVYILFWRKLVNTRAILLVNICVSLGVANILFLALSDKTEFKILCTVVSALLHYFYLVAFFIMLAEGIHIYMSVAFPFKYKPQMRGMLLLSWGVPLFIVGISLGISNAEGYGNSQVCWLSTDQDSNGILYAFVGPVCVIVLCNTVLFILILKAMFGTTALNNKSDQEKAKRTLWSLCVLMPLLGLTWIFGVFSVNEELLLFQYLFAICNSLQGLFIFLFHCLFSQQVRDAIKARRWRDSYNDAYFAKKSTKPEKKHTDLNNRALPAARYKTPRASGRKSYSSSSSDGRGVVSPDPRPWSSPRRTRPTNQVTSGDSSSEYDHNRPFLLPKSSDRAARQKEFSYSNPTLPSISQNRRDSAYSENAYTLNAFARNNAVQSIQYQLQLSNKPPREVDDDATSSRYASSSSTITDLSRLQKLGVHNLFQDADMTAERGPFHERRRMNPLFRDSNSPLSTLVARPLPATPERVALRRDSADSFAHADEFDDYSIYAPISGAPQTALERRFSRSLSDLHLPPQPQKDRERTNNIFRYESDSGGAEGGSSSNGDDSRVERGSGAVRQRHKLPVRRARTSDRSNPPRFRPQQTPPETESSRNFLLKPRGSRDATRSYSNSGDQHQESRFFGY